MGYKAELAPLEPVPEPEHLAAPLNPRDVVLNVYREYHQKCLSLNYGEVREHMATRDDPRNRYRWNATLECGCVTECLTYGRDKPPTDGATHSLALIPDGKGHAKNYVFVIDAGARSYDPDAWVDEPCEYVTARGESYPVITGDPIRQIAEKYLPGSRLYISRVGGRVQVSVTKANYDDKIIDPVAVAVALRGTHKVWLTPREQEIVRELAAAGIEIEPPGTPETYRARVETTYPGLLWCAAHDDEAPIREIVKWVKAEEHVSEKGQQYLSWKVLLSCGHVYRPVLSDFGWGPEHGYRPDLERDRKIKEGLASGQLSNFRHFQEHMATGTWMKPQTHHACYQCRCRKRIVSFEPVGPLTWKGDTVLTTDQAQQRRLQTIERRADELRDQLAQAEAEMRELRGSNAEVH